MREIAASEAKSHFLQLLSDVERGEMIVITRHGRAIARLAPETTQGQEEIARAIAGIRQIRERIRKVSTRKAGVDELLLARHEGHRY